MNSEPVEPPYEAEAAGLEAVETVPPEASGITDHEAYRLVRDGDTAGITHLYAEHAEEVRQRIARCFPKLEAADVVQAAFLNMLTRRQAEEELRGSTAFGYVYTVAIRAAMDMERGQRRRPVCEPIGDYQVDEVPMQVPDHAEQSVDRIVTEMVLARLPELLEELPERQRQAVTAHFQGMGYAETAALHDFTIGTVKSTLSRGLGNLRKLAAIMIGACDDPPMPPVAGGRRV